MAIQSPLLDNISVEGATGVLINIVGGPDLRLKEMDEAASLIQQQAHEDANIIWGASIDETDTGQRRAPPLRACTLRRKSR